MACQHENVGISQDGSQELLCWDCGRSFGHLMRDPKETFVVHLDPDANVAVVVNGAQNVGLGVGVHEARIQATYIYPCAVCGWAGSCGEEGEDCHS